VAAGLSWSEFSNCTLLQFLNSDCLPTVKVVKYKTSLICNRSTNELDLMRLSKRNRQGKRVPVNGIALCLPLSPGKKYGQHDGQASTNCTLSAEK
jgi:hypothetical protein